MDKKAAAPDEPAGPTAWQQVQVLISAVLMQACNAVAVIMADDWHRQDPLLRDESVMAAADEDPAGTAAWSAVYAVVWKGSIRSDTPFAFVIAVFDT